MQLQSTCKLGCPAHINIFEYEIFTDYKITFSDSKELTKKSQIKQKNEKMDALKTALSQNQKVHSV